jgi:putative PIN family toxin of toxin-antitoxin system
MKTEPPGGMLRVVLDTNIHIAARHRPSGLYNALWQAARQGKYVLLISPPLCGELVDVLRRRFTVPENEAQGVMRSVVRVAEMVQPRLTLNAVSADPDDNRVLECALAGKANLIVSNDRHLLNLETFEGIAIITGSDFLRILGL